MTSDLKTIPPQTGTSFRLQRGQLLEVIDPEGRQVADLFCAREDDPGDVLSSGRSIDYEDTIRFRKGNRLFGFSGRVFLEIVEDSCGVHDFLVTPCSLQMFKMLDPRCQSHPSCQENLEIALGEFGVPKSALGTTFNIFMNVPVRSDGGLRVEAPLSKPGDAIRFLAHENLIVGLTACSDEGTNAGRCKPIHYRILDSDQDKR